MVPRIQKLSESEVVLTSTAASTAPPIMAAIELASNSPAIRPSASRGVTRARSVSLTTSQQTSPAPPATVTNSASARASLAAYANCVAQASTPAPTTTSVKRRLVASWPLKTRADEPAHARHREQDPVPARAQVERAAAVNDQLDGLRAVGELHHGHEQEQRDDERRRSRGAHPVHQPGPGTLGSGRTRGPSAQPGEQQRRDRERARVGAERRGRRGHRQEERADRGADHDRQVLHGVQQRVGRPEPGLADQTREKGQHCRPLRAAGGRCQRDDAEDKGDRAVAGGDGGQRQHEHETQRGPPTTRTGRLAYRSATAPPTGPSSTYGSKRQIVAAATQVAEWVA